MSIQVLLKLLLLAGTSGAFNAPVVLPPRRNVAVSALKEPKALNKVIETALNLK